MLGNTDWLSDDTPASAATLSQTKSTGNKKPAEVKPTLTPEERKIQVSGRERERVNVELSDNLGNYNNHKKVGSLEVLT